VSPSRYRVSCVGRGGEHAKQASSTGIEGSLRRIICGIIAWRDHARGCREGEIAD